MVALLIRLKWTLLKAGFRRNGWALAGFVLGTLLGLALAVGACVALASMRGLAPDLAAELVTVVLAALSFGVVLVPLVSTGVDDTLDPSRFALLPVTSRQLLPGLVVGSLVGITGPVLGLGAAGAVIGLARGPVLVAASVVAALLWGLTTIVLRSAAAAGMSAPGTPRWVRDLAMGVGVLLAASTGLLSNLLTVGVDSAEALRHRLDLVTQVVGWTPFGLPWAAVADLEAGRWAAAGLRGVVGLGVLGLLLWWWERSVAGRLVSPLEETGSGHDVHLGRLARLAPVTPAGGVMLRSLLNWRRDPRYVMNFAMAVLMPVLAVGPMLLQGLSTDASPLLPYAGCAVVLSFAMVTMQDTSYDGSAFWLHVSSGMRGWQDRWGRFLAVVTVAAPLVVATVLLGCALSGRWDQLLNALGVSLGLLAVGCGLGQVTSALWQFPAPQAGANQFSTPPGSTLATLLAMVVVWIGLGVVAGGAVALWFATRDHGWVHQLVGPTVLSVGALAAWAGVVGSGRWLERRWPDVLAAVTEKGA